MPASDEIVVIATPSESVSGVFSIGAPLGPSSPGGGTNIQPLVAQNQAAAAKSVEVDDDAKDDEIVVIATKLKGIVSNSMTQMTARMGKSVTLPCLSAQDGAKIRAMIGSIKFKVTSANYGEGRAGQNLANSSTSSIPVNINKDALKGYDKLNGGLLYVIFHEIGHSFKEMRDFSKSQYEQWYKRDGAGLTGQALADAYAKSPEFALNEARANTIARGLIGLLNNMGSIGFDPKHGYTTC